MPSRLTRWLFARFFSVYGIISIPNRDSATARRSRGIRQILHALSDGQSILLFPEGGNVDNFVMAHIRPGVGGLLTLAAKRGAAIVPAGVADDGSGFRVAFGRPIVITDGDTAEAIEAYVGQRIASLIPEKLRGPHTQG